MNCPKCQLAYNRTRKPMVLTCGHTFCSSCTSPNQVSECYSCQNSSKPVVNFALYENLTKKMLSNIDKFIKVCLFGNMAVGKTSILKRLVDNEFEVKTTPTIGIDFKYVDQQVQDKTYRFQIWDSAGQQRYRSMSSDHLKGSDIILLIYDVTVSPQDNDLSFWIYEIDKYATHNNVLVIGNKIDLLHQQIDLKEESNQVLKQEEHIITHRSLLGEERQLIKAKGWRHLKTSCLSNEGINGLWEIMKKISVTTKGVTAEDKSRSIILGSHSINRDPVQRKTKQKRKCC